MRAKRDVSASNPAKILNAQTSDSHVKYPPVRESGLNGAFLVEAFSGRKR
jgi:hypothetical protein